MCIAIYECNDANKEDITWKFLVKINSVSLTFIFSILKTRIVQLLSMKGFVAYKSGMNF